MQRAQGQLRIGSVCVDIAWEVPDATLELDALLPHLHKLDDTIVAVAVAREQAAGREVSCRAGCGACCRQLVPLTMTEAGDLPRLLSGLAPDHRQRVTARFAQAIARLRAAVLLPLLERIATLSREQRVQLGLDYFALGIACPFLEDEACSIHPQRPLSCREYLVTTPAQRCRTPARAQVNGVDLDGSVLNALLRTEAQAPAPVRYVPLILAPFVRRQGQPARRTGAEWVRILVQELTGDDVGMAALRPGAGVR